MNKSLFSSFARHFFGIALMLACVGCSNETESLLSDISGYLRTDASQGDSKAPSIFTARDSVAVEAGLTYTIANGRLMIGNAELTVWTDDITPAGECTVALALDGQTIANGDKVDKEGLLNIEVTDQAGNAANAQMAVSLYTTAVPEVNNIYEDWDSWKWEKIANKNNTKKYGYWYEFYEKIGHVHAMKVIEELDRSGWNDRERKMGLIQIIQGSEYPLSTPLSEEFLGGIWELREQEKYGSSTGLDHAWHIQAIKTRNDKDWLIPGIAQTYRNKIWCYPWARYYNDVLNECKAHPEKKFIAGTAVDDLMSRTPITPDHADYYGFIEIANTSNILFFAALGNMVLSTDGAGEIYRYYGKILSVNEPPQEGGRYGVSSRAVTGPHLIATSTCHYNFTTEILDKKYSTEYTTGLLPIGFSKEHILSTAPYPEIWSDNRVTWGHNLETSYSPFPIVAFAHNILALDPDMSIDDVVNLINSHPISISATYNDQPYNGFDFHTIDFIGMIKEVNLPKAVQSLSSVEVTALPKTGKFPAILYTGQGVECLLDGQWVPVTTDYISTAATFAKVSKAQEFRFNPELWAKQGGSGKAQIKVQLMTADGESIPDVDRLMEVTVTADPSGIRNIKY